MHTHLWRSSSLPSFTTSGLIVLSEEQLPSVLHSYHSLSGYMVYYVDIYFDSPCMRHSIKHQNTHSDPKIKHTLHTVLFLLFVPLQKVPEISVSVVTQSSCFFLSVVTSSVAKKSYQHVRWNRVQLFTSVSHFTLTMRSSCWSDRPMFLWGNWREIEFAVVQSKVSLVDM